MRNLRDPAARERIVSEVLGPPADWENWCRLATPEGSLITGVSRPEHRRLQGMTLAELAAEKETSWIEAAMDLIVADNGSVGMVYFAMSEDNVRQQLALPWIKFGSDAGSWDPERATGMTHPRAYGTYPRILGRYVRDEGALALEDAVRKMTSAVADRVGLSDRGLLREGFMADIVVFDERTIAEHSTYTDPHQLSTGVHHLVVNGERVIRNGGYTGALPGRFVKGRGYRAVSADVAGGEGADAAVADAAGGASTP
jgi:N-acyl-D-amino-acid deacylase